MDEAAIIRFKADVERVLARPLASGEKLALAVSGGPDSMAMLALGAAAFPGRVIAATVDHRLRSESAAEAAMVADWCASAAVEHATLPVEVPPGASGNLQSWARQERYLLLKRWAVEYAVAALCTAHHADDQAETFLMRAARGSGLSGLAAIRNRLDEDVPLSSAPAAAAAPGGWAFVLDTCRLSTIRPLLDWRRPELRQFCEDASIPFVDDPSNDEDRFDRTRFRTWLASAPWFDPRPLGRSAAHLAEAERDLFELSRWLWSQRTVTSPRYEEWIEVADLPRGVRRWLARVAIEAVRQNNGIGQPAWSRATNIEPLLDALEAGSSATQAGVLASASGTVWHFRKAPPRRQNRSS